MVTDARLQIGSFPPASEFGRHWGREYLPYARFDIPLILPELNQPGMPLPTVSFVERYLQSDGHRISDLLAHEIFRDHEGKEIMAPLGRVSDGRACPIVEMIQEEQFTEHFGFQPSIEFAQQQRMYYEVDAMIAGNADALVAARINQAIDCLEHPDNRIGSERIAEIFGLHRSAEIYKQDRDNLRQLTEIALLPETKQRAVLSGGRTALEWLRQYSDQDPASVYCYLVQEISNMMHRGISNLTPDEIKWYRHISSLATQANIGRLREESSDTYLLPGINDAISLLKDTIFYTENPHVFAVVNASLDHKFPIAFSMRYNAFYVTEFFKRSLTKSKLLSPVMLHDGRARVYANVKSINAAAIETAKDTQLQTQIREVAKDLVISASNETEWKGLSNDEKAREALQLFEKIMVSGLERTVSIGLQSRIKEVTEHFATKTFELYDNVRCRLHFKNPEDLDDAVVQAKKRIKGVTLVPGVQQKLGKRLELYLRKSIYLGGSKRERTELRGKEVPAHPGRAITQFVRNLTEGQLAYTAIHAHLPIQMGIAQLHNGVRRKNMFSVEVQMTLKPLAPMMNALERAYKTDHPSLDVLDPEYVNKLRIEAQRALLEFI